MPSIEILGLSAFDLGSIMFDIHLAPVKNDLDMVAEGGENEATSWPHSLPKNSRMTFYHSLVFCFLVFCLEANLKTKTETEDLEANYFSTPHSFALDFS